MHLILMVIGITISYLLAGYIVMTACVYMQTQIFPNSLTLGEEHQNTSSYSCDCLEIFVDNPLVGFLFWPMLCILPMFIIMGHSIYTVTKSLNLSLPLKIIMSPAKSMFSNGISKQIK